MRVHHKTLPKSTRSSIPSRGLVSGEREIKGFLRELIAFGLNKWRIKRYEKVIRGQFNASDKPLRDMTKDDIMTWLVEIQTSKLSDWTKYTRKIMLRKFYRWVGKAELVDWMPISRPKKQRDPASLLTKEEIEEIARHTPYFRDHLFVRLLWESGCRIAELQGLRVMDVSIDEHGCILSVNGKTGRRVVRIVENAEMIREYITDDLKSEDKIFPMSYGCIRMMLRRASRRAKIRKKVNPHSFRFSRATYLANRGLNLFQLMKFFGWKDPDTAQVYIRMSTGDLDKVILSLYERG